MRVIAIYATWLFQRGHDVTVVAPARPAQGKWAQRALRWFGRTIADQSHSSSRHFFGTFDGQLKVLGYYRPIRSIDLPDADVLIATWWETAEWVSHVPDSKGVLVHFVQGHEVFDHLPLERVRGVYRLPTKKITVARWLATTMRDLYGDQACRVVPNAIDHSLFHAEPRDKSGCPTIGTLHHSADFKGFDTALTVLRRLRAKFNNLKVIVFGTNIPDELTLQFPEFAFHSSPAQTSLRNLYAQCDVWLSCSRTEGFNLTAMEAMACRTPVVSTRTGWPEEAIQTGHNGFLTDIDDIDAIEAACSDVLSMDNATWRSLSTAAHATVENANWERSSEMFEDALKAASEGHW